MLKALIFVFSLLQLVHLPTAAAADGFNVKSCLLIQGVSSFYGKNFKKERLSKFAANRKKFDPDAMTAASPNLPFGTKIKVTDRATGRAILVTITDRGPARWTNRVLDLSYGAARKLGMVERGLTDVKIERASGACSRLAENLEETEVAPANEAAEPTPLADTRES